LLKSEIAKLEVA